LPFVGPVGQPPALGSGRSTRSRSAAALSLQDTPHESDASSVNISTASEYSTPATSVVPTPAPSVSADSFSKPFTTRKFGSRVEIHLPAQQGQASTISAKSLRSSQYSLNPKRKRSEVLDSEDEEDGDLGESTDAVLARRLQAEEYTAAPTFGPGRNATSTLPVRRGPGRPARNTGNGSLYAATKNNTSSAHPALSLYGDDKEDAVDGSINVAPRVAASGSSKVMTRARQTGLLKPTPSHLVASDSDDDEPLIAKKGRHSRAKPVRQKPVPAPKVARRSAAKSTSAPAAKKAKVAFEETSGSESDSDSPLSAFHLDSAGTSDGEVDAEKIVAASVQRNPRPRYNRKELREVVALLNSGPDGILFSDTDGESGSSVVSREEPGPPTDSDSSVDVDDAAVASYSRQRRAFRRPTGKRHKKERDRLEEHHPEIVSMWKDLEDQPIVKPDKAPQPTTISRQLKPFQLEGLAWMIEMEKTKYLGGLLGDEMGLGKTIQAVSLIMSDFPAKQPSLVLVPPVALMQWVSEIASYTDGTLKTFVFHGTNAKTKNITVKELKQYDVIMMSYNSLESMYRKQEKGWKKGNNMVKEQSLIHAIHFHRVILDEAHSIKVGPQ
jgi:DNA repair protein RAD16